MTKGYCIAQAEHQRKLAVWAERKRQPSKAAKHRADMAYWLDQAETIES